MSDTPLTDAFINERHTMNAYRKVLKFARQLELRLNDARRTGRIEGLREAAEIAHEHAPRRVYTVGTDVDDRISKAITQAADELEKQS